MDTPILSSDVFKKILLSSSGKAMHEFDWGTIHNIILSSENVTLQDKFIEYNINQGVASKEELDIYFDETSTSDFEFIETYFHNDISIDTLIINQSGGSTFTLHLMSLADLYWTFYSVDGMEFWDVLFKEGDLEDILSVIIWLYLTDRKPDGYHKVKNFLSPHPDNISVYKLQLSHLLDRELTHKLIAQSPISPSFSL